MECVGCLLSGSTDSFHCFHLIAMESMHAYCHLMLDHCSSRARIAGAKRVCEAAPDTLVRQAMVFSHLVLYVMHVMLF